MLVNTEVGPWQVKTVWTGIDKGDGTNESPMIFTTTLIHARTGQSRAMFSPTWGEAEKRHQLAIEEFRKYVAFARFNWLGPVGLGILGAIWSTILGGGVGAPVGFVIGFLVGWGVLKLYGKGLWTAS